MDFSLPTETRELLERTRQFIKQTIIPLENDPRQTAHGPTEEFRSELVGLAKSVGLLTPHASKEMGGLGLSHLAKAAIFEAAGYSRLGPVAMNIHAPDEGNIHMMEAIASPSKRTLVKAPSTRQDSLLFCHDRTCPWCWIRPIHVANFSCKRRC